MSRLLTVFNCTDRSSGYASLKRKIFLCNLRCLTNLTNGSPKRCWVSGSSADHIEAPKMRAIVAI